MRHEIFRFISSSSSSPFAEGRRAIDKGAVTESHLSKHFFFVCTTEDVLWPDVNVLLYTWYRSMFKIYFRDGLTAVGGLNCVQKGGLSARRT